MLLLMMMFNGKSIDINPKNKILANTGKLVYDLSSAIPSFNCIATPYFLINKWITYPTAMNRVDA